MSKSSLKYAAKALFLRKIGLCKLGMCAKKWSKDHQGKREGGKEKIIKEW